MLLSVAQVGVKGHQKGSHHFNLLEIRNKIRNTKVLDSHHSMTFAEGIPVVSQTPALNPFFSQPCHPVSRFGTLESISHPGSKQVTRKSSLSSDGDALMIFYNYLGQNCK